MARHSSRLSRLVRWQYIRWGLAFPTFTLALWACNSHDLQVPKPNPQQETDFSILVSPERQVDILFMIDNSPSMDPKQKALASNFPNMIKALEQLEGGLPDVHVGVISSDMGAGGGEAGGNCAVVLGNQGILWGNDPSQNPDDLNNKYATIKNIKDGCGLNSGARWIQDIRNIDGISRDKNYTGNLADVFSCMASAVGVNGCGYEHQLQSVRVALNPAEKINPQNFNFLRPKAFLAVVLITDEDDCSADPSTDTNDGMFFPRTLGDTASLRCAARGHVCNGKDIPNYDPATGYTSTEKFETDFANCEAKDDTGSSRDYKKLPLIRIRDMIDSVTQVKQRPTEQVLVSGIIGWPEENKLDGVKYRIDKDLTSMPVDQQKLWDYMPICTVAGEKSADGNIYKAYGGFRLKKFIDGFGNNGQVFSLCNSTNFAAAMKQIGNAIASKIRPGCVPYPLIDSNPLIDEVQPECQVMDMLSCDTPGQGTCLKSGYEAHSIPECKIPGSGAPLNPVNPEKTSIPDEQRPCWYLVYDKDETTGCPAAFKNQRITALRVKDGAAPAGTLLDMKCLTCAAPPKSPTESSCPAVGTM